MSDVLQARSVVKMYQQKGKKERIRAVDHIDFTLQDGDCLGIIGESGCGKSTLGRLMVGLERPDQGSIIFQGRERAEWLKKDRLGYRRLCQMVFQNPYDAFDPRNTIRKILTTPLQIHHIGRNRKEREEICTQMLERSGFSAAEGYMGRYPRELSGGQLQRVAILRAMLLEPKILVTDEPVSMLDVSVRASILQMLQQLRQEKKIGMFFISHDIGATRYIADRVAVMYLGQFVEMSPMEEFLKNPEHPYAQALLSNSMGIEDDGQNPPITLPGSPGGWGNKNGCRFAPRCWAAQKVCFQEQPAWRQVRPGHTVRCWK